MTQSNPFISSINSGEFSPRMEGRIDFDRYPNAAKMCRNLLLLPQGGLTRRPGSRFIKEVKDSSAAAIIFPFQFSEDAAYVVEGGDAYFRFYKRQARLAAANISTTVSDGDFTSDPSTHGWTLVGAVWNSTPGTVTITSAGTFSAYASTTITVASGDVNVEHTFKLNCSGFGIISVLITDPSIATVYNHSFVPGYHTFSFTPASSGDYTIILYGINFNNAKISESYIVIDDFDLLDNVPIEIVTPYAVADVDDLRFFQAADVCYILRQSYAPHRLERHGDKDWSLVPVSFLDGPYFAANYYPDLDVIPFDYTSVQLITNPFFENGLVGWTDASSGDGHVYATSNGAEIDDGTSGGSGVGSLRTSFASTSLLDYYAHAYVGNQPVTLNVGTTAGGTGIINATVLKPGWNHFIITAASSTTHIEFKRTGHSGERSSIGSLTVYGSDARVFWVDDLTGVTTITSDYYPFKATDAGRIVRLVHDGYEPGYAIVLDGVADGDYSTSALILSPVASTVPTENWSLGAFGGTPGYPKAIGFFDGRLILANTPAQPQTLWASAAGDLENMRPDSFVDGLLTVEADDAITVTLAAKSIDPIQWIGGLSLLILGTGGLQWSVASQGGVITPADIFAKINSAIPAGDLEVVQVSQAVIFADKTKREVYEMAYSTEQSGYVPELLTILSEHILHSPAHQMVYQRRPNSILWCPRDDGRAATMSYNRQHQVLGWSQQIMGGSFGSGDAVIEHMAVIPGADDDTQTYDSGERDEVWLIVKRTINGTTKRYIEVLEGEFIGPYREDYDTEQDWWDAVRTAQKDAVYVDSAITYSGSSTTAISGLDHLEGETVKVWADGKPQADKVVASGAITLDTAAAKVQIGLGYTHKYLSLKLPTGAQQGTAVGKMKMITGVGIVVLDCVTFEITTASHDRFEGRTIHDLYTVDFRKKAMSDPTVAPPLYTGEIHENLQSKQSSDPRLYIESDTPGPFTLIGLAPEIDGTDEPDD